MDFFNTANSLAPQYLTYSGLIRHDEREELPYQMYIPVIDQNVAGTSIYDVLTRGREMIGTLLMERVMDHEDLPQSDETLPTGDADEMPTFINVELDRFKHLIAPKETVIAPMSALKAPKQLLSQVYDFQPVFITEDGIGRYVIVSMKDYDMFQNAIGMVLDKQDIADALDDI
ncbi:hypothetical protein HC026_03410 [Lactobacillus sp. LC28-10]|uniref:Uncharacterized protein n=1 Tax=Secundilactobacillus angelensis TaxID=2722706 RepID=A0ABX1KVL4_9LACO|nr:hypothetical protein [Secundilactobacillus angelensis]MCH5461672.1 hypothetical protein [Secundilactobacillus angelensis]NLR17968.1 hypothetical protein [Secundilactobacillus angelensis]